MVLRRIVAGAERWREMLMLLLLAAILGCDDPTAFIELPAGIERRLAVRLVLVPGTTVQPMWLTAVDVGDPNDVLEDVRVEVHSGSELVARADSALFDVAPCSERYGTLGYNSASACLALEFDPAPGQRYDVHVTGAGRPDAMARTLVPDTFAILDAETAGDPPGTEGISAVWTRSASAHGYLVALRPSQTDCTSVQGCSGGWFQATTDTTLEATVPGRLLHQGDGRWSVDIYAVDRALFEYLTTGSGDEFFPIPPVSNVEGGHGVVGAWLRRSTDS